MFAPVVEGSRGQDHGEFIGHLSTVGPATPGFIPEVTPCQKTHHPLRKALPHHKGEVHLQRDEVAMRRGFLTKILIAYGSETSLTDKGWAGLRAQGIKALLEVLFCLFVLVLFLFF